MALVNLKSFSQNLSLCLSNYFQIPPVFISSVSGILFCNGCSIENKQMGLKKIQKYKWARNCLGLFNGIKRTCNFSFSCLTNKLSGTQIWIRFYCQPTPNMFFFVFFLLKSKAHSFFFNSYEWMINDWYLGRILNYGGKSL